MLDSARQFMSSHVSSHADVSKLVRNAQRFSLNVPLIGKVSVPPPDQLAFYSVLTVLGVTELIPWPVAVGLGVGHALATRHATEAASEAAGDAVAEALIEEAEAQGAAVTFTPAAKAPAERPAARKAPVKSAATRQP